MWLTVSFRTDFETLSPGRGPVICRVRSLPQLVPLEVSVCLCVSITKGSEGEVCVCNKRDQLLIVCCNKSSQCVHVWKLLNQALRRNIRETSVWTSYRYSSHSFQVSFYRPPQRESRPWPTTTLRKKSPAGPHWRLGSLRSYVCSLSLSWPSSSSSSHRAAKVISYGDIMIVYVYWWRVLYKILHESVGTIYVRQLSVNLGLYWALLKWLRIKNGL